MSNYASKAEGILREELAAADPNMAARTPFNDDLTSLYLLLMLTRGETTTSEEVHDAWSAATLQVNPTHRSLLPFGQLTPEVRAYDDLYRDAIRAASRRYGREDPRGGNLSAGLAEGKPTFGTAPWRFEDAHALRAVDGDTQVYKSTHTILLPGEVVTVEREWVVRILETDSPERRTDYEGWLAEKRHAEDFLFRLDGAAGAVLPVPLDELVLTGRRDVYGRWLGWAVAGGLNLSYELNREFGREAEPLEAQVLRLTGEAA